MSAQAPTTIRSFRVCFKVERRIHKIDRWRIPLPFGVPLRGAAYALGLLLVVALARRVPLAGGLLATLPAPLRLLALPVGGAWALTSWELDGRPAHAVGLAWLRMRLTPSRLVAWRPAPRPCAVRLAEIALVADERGARLRPAVIEGPCHVLMRYPFHSRARGRVMRVSRSAGGACWRGKEIRLKAGQRLVIG